MAMADTFTSTTVRVRCFFANGTQIASATVSFSLFLGQ
jgi:sRNA-binding regulator protein Hfq